MARPKQQQTIAAYAAGWHDPGWSDVTARHNLERVRAFVADFGRREPASVSRDEAELWIVGGQAPPELRSTAKAWEGVKVARGGRVEVPPHRGNLSAVRAMFNTMVREGLVPGNPFSRVLPTPQTGAPVIVTPGELDLLVQVGEELHGEYGPTFSAMVEFAAWSGLQPNELLSLPWDAVDQLDRKICVRWVASRNGKIEPAKGHRRREVFLTPKAREALERVPPLTEYVWHTKRGARMTQRVAHQYWAPVRAAFRERLPRERRGQVPADFAFGDLRHYFGAALASLGVSPHAIAEQMGDADGGKRAKELYLGEEWDSHAEVERAFMRARAVGE